MSDRGALAAAREVGSQEVIQVELEQEVAESAEAGEQKETEETKEEGTGEGETLTPALSHGEREQAAERIRQSELLPVGLRTRLAELVLASDSAAAEQAIRAVEASLPGALRISASDVARPAHPAGDVFFQGDADAMSEEQAEALARGQLARSGMLRGQRARVGE